MKICNVSREDLEKIKFNVSKVDFNNSYKIISENHDILGYFIIEKITLKEETKNYSQYENKEYWDNLYKKNSKKIGYIKINKELIETGDFYNIFDLITHSFKKNTLLWIDINNNIHLKYINILQGFNKIEYTNTFDYIRLFEIS